MTDEQLIEELRSGNMMAFGELYRSHRDPLVRFARLQVGEAPAEDIVQEVFMNLWTQREHLQTLESPRSYLLRAVHNRALNYLRDESHRSDFRNQYQRNIEILAASRSNPDGGISLHARSISFVHPVRKEEMTVTAPLPPSWKGLESFDISL